MSCRCQLYFRIGDDPPAIPLIVDKELSRVRTTHPFYTFLSLHRAPNGRTMLDTLQVEIDELVYVSSMEEPKNF